MLVDVVKLRERGAKLSPDHLGHAPVHRGQLRLVQVDTLPIRRWTGPVAALLVEPGSSRYLLPPLDAARETRRRSANEWLLAGIEEAEFPGRQWRRVPQVWWIRRAG